MTHDAAQPGDLSLRKKLLFGVLVLAVFLALLEGLLALAGVRPVLRDDDPFLGFAATVPLFVQAEAADGTPVWRTAPNKRLFNPQEFPVAKAPGTVRIFCVGGSTTFGRPYDDTSSFAAWLRELLPVAAPGTRFEVINAGGVSYASYRVARLMQELVRYEPDLFVVYSGQNEFLEERTYRGLRRVPAPVRAVSGVLARTRTWAAMGAVLDRTGLRRGGAGQAPGTRLAGEADTLLEHFGPEVYTRDDALHAQILAHYEISLERMARIAAGAGAGVVYVTPASNLKDCSPFRSQHTEGLGEADAAAVEAALQAARAQLRADDPDAALALLDRALTLDPRHAELHYRRGEALLAAGRAQEALGAFTRAVEEDVCPLRALPTMQRSVAAVARRFGAGHVDFAALVEADARAVLGQPVPGNEHFLDHVHPTIAAHGLLAAALVDPVLAQVGLAPAAITPDDLAAAGARIEARLDPAQQARALANLARVTAWSGKLEDAVAPARQALAFPEADAVTVASAASILATWHALQGEVDEERRFFATALAATPGDHDLHFRIALRELDRPQPDRELAAAHLVYAAVYWQGENRDAPHRTLAGLLAARGLFRPALSHLLEARAVDPTDPETGALLARVGERLGPAAAGAAPPLFTVDRYPSGGIRRIVQVTRDAAGGAVPDGVWTEWHENGRPARYAEVEGTRVVGADAAWDADGRRLAAAGSGP